MQVLIGGVSELLQGDLDAGRAVLDRLHGHDLGTHVLVEDLSYGGVAVAQRLEDLAPDALIVVGAVRRGRLGGTVARRRVLVEEAAARPDGAEAVRDAVTGYVGAELVIDVAAALGALPPRTVLIDVEPVTTEPGAGLSPEVDAALDVMVALVRTEAERLPLLTAADAIRPLLEGGRLGAAPATEAMRQLIGDIDGVDRDGTWGATFRTRDRVRLEIAANRTGEGMEHLDWALWWAVIEELDRLEAAAAMGGP